MHNYQKLEALINELDLSAEELAELFAKIIHEHYGEHNLETFLSIIKKQNK